MNPLLQFKATTLLRFIAFTVTCFALSPRAQAQLSPEPDGGYPGGNTAEGAYALYSLIPYLGQFNTAIGDHALYSNTTGGENTANGALALVSNTTGYENTANGFRALFNNKEGYHNTANGVDALYNNTQGFRNMAIGYQALYSNTTGYDNIAIGEQALYFNTTGFDNIAYGAAALIDNTTGYENIAIGVGTLGFFNSTGHGNTAIGAEALPFIVGSNNIALGDRAAYYLKEGDNNIDIGNPGIVFFESNTIRIGTVGTQKATYIAGITGKTSPGGVPVFVDANGQLGTATSSIRFKDQVKPMDSASEVILALKPVTFRYKKEIDAAGTAQFGLVAEEVEKVNRDLVVRDEKGKPYSVRYDAVNAMLLNEFLKEHRTVQELKSTAAKQEAIIAQQQKQIEALTVGLQKVSAQVQMSKAAPQMVINNQ